MARKRMIQVRTPGTGWATYPEEESRAVVEAFRAAGIPVETREPPKRRNPQENPHG